MVPDKKELDRGFYDVTLLDITDEVEPVMPISDLGLLQHQMPAPVLSNMSQQMDYEKIHQECKRRFRGAQTGCCTHCGTVIKFHFSINGRVRHRTV